MNSNEWRLISSPLYAFMAWKAENLLVNKKFSPVLPSAFLLLSVLLTSTAHLYSRVKRSVERSAQVMAYRAFFFHDSTALVDLDLLIVEVSRSHSDPTHSVRLLWTNDRSVAETSAWQFSRLNRQTSMFSGRFEPGIPASDWPQIRALGREVTGIDWPSNLYI